MAATTQVPVSRYDPQVFIQYERMAATIEVCHFNYFFLKK